MKTRDGKIAMNKRDSESFGDAHRRMRRSLREKMVLRADLTSDDRAELIARYKAELDKLHQDKERALQVFEDEIHHREDLIARLEEASGKAQQTQQLSPRERVPGKGKPAKAPDT